MRALVLGLGLALSVCACNCNPPPPSSCDAGCACDGGSCMQPTGVTLQVSDLAVRGCEVLLTEQPGSRVASVTFGAGVKGTFLREAPKVAVSFVSTADAAPGASSVQLTLEGTGAKPVVTRSSCVDVRGARLPNAAPVVR